jgi:hypothetical protein
MTSESASAVGNNAGMHARLSAGGNYSEGDPFIPPPMHGGHDKLNPVYGKV